MVTWLVVSASLLFSSTVGYLMGASLAGRRGYRNGVRDGLRAAEQRLSQRPGALAIVRSLRDEARRL